MLGYSNYQLKKLLTSSMDGFKLSETMVSGSLKLIFNLLTVY